MQFCALSQVCGDLLCSSQKTKAAASVPSVWRCGWLCTSLIVQATGGRVKGMAASPQDVLREGGIGVSLPPSLFPLSLSFSSFLLLFHSLHPKLAAGRQINAVWSEPTEVQGPAVQATKELHARHLLFSYQNTFSHVPPFPSPSLHSSSTTAPQHPFCQLWPSLFLSAHFSSSLPGMLLKCLIRWHPHTHTHHHLCDIHSFTTIILLPTSSLGRRLNLNGLGPADNPGVLPTVSVPKCTNLTWMIMTRPAETADES